MPLAARVPWQCHPDRVAGEVCLLQPTLVHSAGSTSLEKRVLSLALQPQSCQQQKKPSSTCVREGMDPGSAELASLLFARGQKSTPPLIFAQQAGIWCRAAWGWAEWKILPAPAAIAVLLHLWCGGWEGGKEKPHPGKPAARGRRGQGGVKVRGPRPMCFLLPALARARGSGEGRESRKYRSGAGRGCRRAQPFLCCARCRTLPTTPGPEGSPRGPARAARPWQPIHSPRLGLGRETWLCAAVGAWLGRLGASSASEVPAPAGGFPPGSIAGNKQRWHIPVKK